MRKRFEQQLGLGQLPIGKAYINQKKESTVLRLKTDSFVVESNVHFPTGYNLLWDCARKCLDVVSKFLKKYKGIRGWRKTGHWRGEIKGLMREMGRASSSGGKAMPTSGKIGKKINNMFNITTG
jgi:hypothetical protein